MRDQRYPGPLAEELRFAQWLAGATPQAIGRTTIADLLQRHRLDARWMEAKLLARQDQIRREVMGAPV